MRLIKILPVLIYRSVVVLPYASFIINNTSILLEFILSKDYKQINLEVYVTCEKSEISETFPFCIEKLLRTFRYDTTEGGWSVTALELEYWFE